MLNILRKIFGGVRRQIIDQLRNDPETLRERLAVEAQSYFEGLKDVSDESGMNISQEMGFTMLDLTSDKEKRIEQDAHSGMRIGTAFDALVAELRAIGARREYTIVEDNPFWGTDEYDGCTHVLTHEIGQILNDAGGMDLMKCVYHRVKAAGADSRDLERNWNDIGDWCG